MGKVVELEAGTEHKWAMASSVRESSSSSMCVVFILLPPLLVTPSDIQFSEMSPHYQKWVGEQWLAWQWGFLIGQRVIANHMHIRCLQQAQRVICGGGTLQLVC